MILEFKKSGETMDTFIKNIKIKYNNVKIAYTARLDPMAQGIVPILFNEECKLMSAYLNKNKIYRVKIIEGLKTDTDDPLGLFINMKQTSLERDVNMDDNTLPIDNNEFNSNNVSLEQKYHYYSTKEINKRRRNILGQSTHSVYIYKCHIVSEGTYNSNDLACNIINTISNIDKTKNFRQKEIIEQWENIKNNNVIYKYYELEINVSSGFFIRQFCQDISNKYNINLMCMDINRISIY